MLIVNKNQKTVVYSVGKVLLHQKKKKNKKKSLLSHGAPTAIRQVLLMATEEIQHKCIKVKSKHKNK